MLSRSLTVFGKDPLAYFRDVLPPTALDGQQRRPRSAAPATGRQRRFRCSSRNSEWEWSSFWRPPRQSCHHCERISEAPNGKLQIFL